MSFRKSDGNVLYYIIT